MWCIVFFMACIYNSLTRIYFIFSSLCPSCFTQAQNLKTLSFHLFRYVGWFFRLIHSSHIPTTKSNRFPCSEAVPLLSFLPTFTMQHHTMLAWNLAPLSNNFYCLCFCNTCCFMREGNWPFAQPPIRRARDLYLRFLSSRFIADQGCQVESTRFNFRVFYLRWVVIQN